MKLRAAFCFLTAFALTIVVLNGVDRLIEKKKAKEQFAREVIAENGRCGDGVSWPEEAS